MPGELKSLTVITPSGYIMDLLGRSGDVHATVNMEFTSVADWDALHLAHRWLAAEGWDALVAGDWVCPVEIDEFLSTIS